jgi:hypothetical protein
MTAPKHKPTTPAADSRAVWFVGTADPQALAAKEILSICNGIWSAESCAVAPVVLVHERAHTQLVRRLRERMPSLAPVLAATFLHSWLDGGATLIQGGLDSADGVTPALLVNPSADSLWLRPDAPRAAALLVLRVSDQKHAESLLSSLGATVFQTARWE